MNLVRKLWQRGRDLLPIAGFHFDRPMVLVQSDDWGRCGLRDQEGVELLRSAGIVLGERPYDFYTLETAEDLSALHALLKRHHDSGGRSPCVEMNFVPANLDFAKMSGDGFQQIHLLALADGLPQGWNRPGLIDAYREGIARRSFLSLLCTGARISAARRWSEIWLRMEIAQYFCVNFGRRERPIFTGACRGSGMNTGIRSSLRTSDFWPAETQRGLIGHTVGAFAKLFSTLAAVGVRSRLSRQRRHAPGLGAARNSSGAEWSRRFRSAAL